MDLKETGKKLKPFAPVLSVAVVASCVAGTLSGYQPPVYAVRVQTDLRFACSICTPLSPSIKKLS